MRDCCETASQRICPGHAPFVTEIIKPIARLRSIQPIRSWSLSWDAYFFSDPKVFGDVQAVLTG